MLPLPSLDSLSTTSFVLFKEEESIQISQKMFNDNFGIIDSSETMLSKSSTSFSIFMVLSLLTFTASVIYYCTKVRKLEDDTNTGE
mmetsp:Transcript_7953/g.13358  ORF Transcript_7953/g.13358 Transcript_7953/m.13358 type:complete len:86 (+) Transcript_7953:3046-3303(+)